ncbi:MAG: hypothetical protein OEZ10_05000 [Gammaproteobacteria bacterium]|nr:hypothetical protein [Gammaproteobacteria bacterium]
MRLFICAKTAIEVIVMLPALAGSITAFAEEQDRGIALILAADYAEKRVEHTFKAAGPGGADVVFDGEMSAAAVALTAAKGGFYISLNAEMPLREETTPIGESLLFLERDDYALTLGYSVFERISVFAGYKYGKTRITNVYTDVDLSGPTPRPYLGSSEFDLIEEGPFLGLAYNQPINEGNWLGVNVAYGFMDSEIVNHTLATGGGNTGPASGSGDTEGFSFGVRWSHAFSAATQVAVGYKMNTYDNEGADITGTGYKYESVYNYITLGLSHYF